MNTTRQYNMGNASSDSTQIVKSKSTDTMFCVRNNEFWQMVGLDAGDGICERRDFCLFRRAAQSLVYILCSIYDNLYSSVSSCTCSKAMFEWSRVRLTLGASFSSCTYSSVVERSIADAFLLPLANLSFPIVHILTFCIFYPTFQCFLYSTTSFSSSSLLPSISHVLNTQERKILIKSKKKKYCNRTVT